MRNTFTLLEFFRKQQIHINTLLTITMDQYLCAWLNKRHYKSVGKYLHTCLFEKNEQKK